MRGYLTWRRLNKLIQTWEDKADQQLIQLESGQRQQAALYLLGGGTSWIAFVERGYWTSVALMLARFISEDQQQQG